MQQFMMPNIDMLIPYFSGSPGENFNAFLKNFNEIAEEFRWSEGAKLIWLRSRLTGDAKKLWETLNQIETVDFKKITDQLTELYGSVGSKYSTAKLVKFIAEPSESINPHRKCS